MCGLSDIPPPSGERNVCPVCVIRKFLLADSIFAQFVEKQYMHGVVIMKTLPVQQTWYVIIVLQTNKLQRTM